MSCKERLTIKYDGNFVPKEFRSIDRNGNVEGCNSCEEICSDIYDGCEGCPIQKCFDRLGELEDKLENGTMIELPCKAGDTVYYIEPFLKPKIWAEKVTSIHYKQGLINEILLFFNSCFHGCGTYGKTVFLTKEEAEARLKELSKNA